MLWSKRKRICHSLAYFVIVFHSVPSAWPQNTSASETGLPVITSATGASGFGNVGPTAPGSWIEIHGTNLAPDTRSWGPADFTPNAPVSLDGVGVSIGSQAAYVSYISPTQVNALVPSGLGLGSQPILVSNGGNESAPLAITVDQITPGLWSPPIFNIGGIQYVGAVFPDFKTFVLPAGAVPGLPSRPAGPGDTIILLGIGFGSVTPGFPAGQLVTQTTQLNLPVQFSFGQTSVTPLFAGLAPEETGVYQFSVPVPNGVGAGVVPFSFSVAGSTLNETQQLWIALSQSPSLQVSAVQNLAGQAGVTVPGDMLLIEGSGFAAGNTTEQYPLPTTVGGISASFNGFPAPIASMGPQQMQVQVPWEMLGLSTATLTVTDSNTGSSVSTTVNLQNASPQVPSATSGFRIQIEGSGGASPAQASASSNNRPVLPGEFLDIPAIGLGIQKDGPADGQPASASSPGNSLRGVMVQIGSAWAPVSSAALIPGSTGVSLIRVQVPINAPVGNSVPLAITAWGMTSNPVNIAVGNASGPTFQLEPADGTFGMYATSYSFSLVSSTVTSSQLTLAASAMKTPMVEPAPQPGFINPSVGSASGFSYTGPFNTGLPEYMLLTATLNSNPAIFATTRVLVTEGPANFHITPRDVVIGPTDTVTFQALDDSGNQVPVSWEITGAVGSNYTNIFQPESYDIVSNPSIVRAYTNASVLSGGSADQTMVYVIPSAPRIVSLNPVSPSPGDTVVITTQGLQVSNVTVNFTRVDGTTFGVAATNGDNQIGIRIPPDAVEGPIQIAAQPVNSAAVLTAPFEAAISPKLRLHAEQIEIAQGESTRIDVAFLFDARPRALRWSSTYGSVDSTGLFTAPASVSQTLYVRITACLTDRNVCGWSVVAVQPFRFRPAQPAVAAGGSVQLEALAAGSAVPVTWQTQSPNITITSNGLVRASSGPLDGGLAEVDAIGNSGTFRTVNVSVTGSQGGMVSVAREFLDWPNGVAFGPGYQNMVVIGNYGYVLCTNFPDNSYIAGYQANWLDTWDITDPLNPKWLAATGIPTGNASLTKLNGSLLVEGEWTLTVGFSSVTNSIALVYGLANGIPILTGYTIPQPAPVLAPTAAANMNGNIGYTITNTAVFRQDFGTLSPGVQLPVQLPAAFANASHTSAIGDDSRLFLAYTNFDQTGQLFVYDMTVSPMALLSTIDIDAYSPALYLFGNTLVCGTTVYTLSGSSPQLAAQLPISDVSDADPARLRVLGPALGGMRIVDLTNPNSPRVSAATPFLEFNPPYMRLAPGDTFIAVNGELETYSVVWTGGPQNLSTFGDSATNWDQKSRGNLVFLAQGLYNFLGLIDPRIFEVYDVTNTANPQLIGTYQDSTQSANAVQISGNYAFLACDNDFVVLDISNPATPTRVASLPIGGITLALSGTHMIIGELQNETSELVIVDISVPTAPVVAGRLSLSNPAYGIALNGATMAVGTAPGGLSLYDISNPSAPAILWSAADGIPVWAVAWSGNLLYAASDQRGLIIWDASNPRLPIYLGSNNLTDYQFNYFPCCVYTPTAISVYLSGGMAWVGTTNSYGTLFGLDVRNSASPRVINFMRYGAEIDGDAVTSIGTVGGNLLTGGSYASFTSMNLISIDPPGNTIRPAPPQTLAGDVQPPLQLSSAASVSSSAQARRQTGAAPVKKLKGTLDRSPGSGR